MKNSLAKEKNYSYCQETLRLEVDARKLYFELGERLYEIREKQLFLPAWDSWDIFCMEFSDMSQGSISKIISVYEKFVVQFGYTAEELVPAGGWTKLYEIGKQVNTRKEADKWIEEAKELTRSDLQKSLTEERTGVSQSDCKHKNTYTVEICRDCGLRMEQHQHD